jgi:hypothetical protein
MLQEGRPPEFPEQSPNVAGHEKDCRQRDQNHDHFNLLDENEPVLRSQLDLQVLTNPPVGPPAGGQVVAFPEPLVMVEIDLRKRLHGIAVLPGRSYVENLNGFAAISFDALSEKATVGQLQHGKRVALFSGELEQCQRPELIARHTTLAFECQQAEDRGPQRIPLLGCFGALHWFDRERFFAEVTRVLRPGGVTKSIDASGNPLCSAGAPRYSTLSRGLAEAICSALASVAMTLPKRAAKSSVACPLPAAQFQTVAVRGTNVAR